MVEHSDEEEFRDRIRRSFTPYKIGTEVATKVSKALDKLLFESGYDKRIRPQVKFELSI